MTEAAALYRRTHALLRTAKLSDWRISRTPAGHWRLTHPGGAGFTIAGRPTVRGLIDAEEQMAWIEREHPTAGTGPAQQRTEP